MVTIAPRPIIPEAFLVPCDALPNAKDGQLSTLLQNHVEVAKLYHLCAQRQADLVGVLRGQESEAER